MDHVLRINSSKLSKFWCLQVLLSLISKITRTLQTFRIIHANKNGEGRKRGIPTVILLERIWSLQWMVVVSLWSCKEWFDRISHSQLWNFIMKIESASILLWIKLCTYIKEKLKFQTQSLSTCSALPSSTSKIPVFISILKKKLERNEIK